MADLETQRRFFQTLLDNLPFGVAVRSNPIRFESTSRRDSR
jgi:hypothetical protein